MHKSIHFCFIMKQYCFETKLANVFIHKFSSLSDAQTKQREWESVIGLEVHAQISAKSKLFSGASNLYGSPVNSLVSYFDAGHPGTLPVLNRRCVEAGILTSLALGCTINKKSVFDRKHYFYADLPVGYQITQQRVPLATNGKLSFVTSDSLVTNFKSYKAESKIKQVQLEQDSGKSMHDEKASCSLIDLNRAGAPLMEIVFEPDLKTGAEAASLVNELRTILLKLGTCNCRMDEGSLRVDVNISVNKPGEPLGVRTEIKNLNSVRSVANAVESEISRQIDLLSRGIPIENETRMYVPQQKKTIAMRDKEKVQDYRFMPEPNLPPLLLCDDNDNATAIDLINIDDLRRQLPELPEQARQRLIDSFELSYQIANQIVQEEVVHQSFYFLIRAELPIKKIINFLLNHLIPTLSSLSIDVSKCPITPVVMLQLLEMEMKEVITIATTLQLLEVMARGDTRMPNEIVDQNNWYQIHDEEKLETLCQEIIKENATLVNSKKGKSIIYNTLVTKVRERTESRANMKIVCRMMSELLYQK